MSGPVQHTPGRWVPAHDAQGTCGIMHPTKPGVAIAWFSSSFVPADGYVGEAEPALGRPEREANARLFLAAPRLATTLREDVITDDVFNLVVNGHLLEDEARERMERAVIESLPALYARVRMVLEGAGYGQ